MEFGKIAMLLKMTGPVLAVTLAAGGAVLADTAPPTATTATYGAWTVACNVVPQADGSPAKPLCQMTTRLNLKGQDGQMHPLLAFTIGTPPGAKAARLALQVPTDVALRAGVTISLDQPAAAGADATAPRPQEDLLQLTYLTCAPQGCIADSDGSADLWTRLKAVPSANVSFTALAGQKKIVVPVSLDGFTAAMAALDANAK